MESVMFCVINLRNAVKCICKGKKTVGKCLETL